MIWIGVSTYWHACRIKELCHEQTVSVSVPKNLIITPLEIRDGSELYVLSKGNFAFAKSGHNPDFTSVETELDSLVSYLKRNPQKNAKLTGYYSLNETTPAGYKNLGMARAEKVKDYLLKWGLSDSVLITNGEL